MLYAIMFGKMLVKFHVSFFFFFFFCQDSHIAGLETQISQLEGEVLFLFHLLS